SADVLEDVQNDLNSVIADASQPGEQVWQVFSERLGSLLDVRGSLEVLLKAGPLRFERQHVLEDARILTDIRPIFDDEIEARPVAALITHELRLSYMQAEEHKEFLVALSSTQLDKLRQAI